ncbi:histidinol dehydrogenase [Ferrimonas balearica]|uniref:histidinol dehydrogenase n=1 Tax=Ferrimonas balearica TaxID=44012 RepID=UPI001C99F229|nr:histidinol dehydrogenase [Ferrimonas balearica]MBY5920602.1 histidinol dehydrogenase [Ferrimonas balearica]MBY5996713.1 histidinol dehydrogenase [Ferrimonas balearica]
MERVIWQQLDKAQQCRVLARSEMVQDNQVADAVSRILETVRRQGDAGLIALTEQFDGAMAEEWQLGPEQMAAAGARLEQSLKSAIDQAIDNIGRFHSAQQPQTLALDVAQGVRCELRSEAIERVGLYVPGGTAPLISTVLMLALPARIAGCPLKVMVTPPPVNDAILYAASRCGVDCLYTIGGAQAVAALAYGTESVPRVDKIFGPGNRFVTEAKRQVSQQGTAIDMPAGPSEVLVIADDSANPEFVAADLLSQAEHGEDSQVMLVTNCPALADAVEAAVTRQLATLPRADIARVALSESRVILATTLEQACEISNAYAPEHLIVQTRAPRDLLPQLRAAGSIFLGPWTPESVGDYASGTNHVLPTYGAARTASSLSLADFQRRFTVQELSREGLAGLSNAVTTLAEAEGLRAHANAVTLRMETQS